MIDSATNTEREGEREREREREREGERERKRVGLDILQQDLLNRTEHEDINLKPR